MSVTALWDTGTRGEDSALLLDLSCWDTTAPNECTKPSPQHNKQQFSCQNHTLCFTFLWGHSRWNRSSWSANTPEKCHRLHLPEKGNVSSQQHRKSQTWTNWPGLSGKKWVSAKTVIMINGKEVKLIRFSAPALIGGAGGAAVRWKLKLMFF